MSGFGDFLGLVKLAHDAEVKKQELIQQEHQLRQFAASSDQQVQLYNKQLEIMRQQTIIMEKQTAIQNKTMIVYIVIAILTFVTLVITILNAKGWL